MTPESQIKRFTVPEFAKRVRAKYPEYQDLTDDDLTTRILERHPEYKTQVAYETRERSFETTLAKVGAAKREADKAANAYTSAGGRALNPTVTPGTDYFRPLTTTEKAAQKRGEPVIISEAAPQPPIPTPQLPSRPRRTGILEKGNIDLTNRPRVKNPDGTISTVRSISVNIDGREVLLPTVSDDGRILTRKQAVDQYRQTGKHLGVFDNPTSATTYAQKLHEDQAKTLNAPVSLAPVIQGRLEQIKQEKRQREIQQKVAKARAVRERRPDIVTALQRVAAQANKIAPYVRQHPQPLFDKGIPDLTKIAREEPLTFAEDRAARTEAQRQMNRLRGRAGAATDFGEEYQNFLRLNRSLDSTKMREDFLTLKAKQRIQQHGSPEAAMLAEDLETARRERVAKMGTGEYLAQAPKAAVGGLAGGAGTTLKGLALVSKKLADQVMDTKGLEAKDTYVYRLGEYITDLGKDNPVFKSNPDLEKEFLVGKAPDTIGQSVMFLLGGAVSKSPKLAVTILGSGMTAGDAYDEVKSLGGSEEHAVNAALLAGALLGPTELIGMRGAMHAIEGTVAETTLKAALKTALREGRRDIIENALQEFGQELGQGLITGNPRTLPQLVEAGLLGAVGGIQTIPTSLGASALESRRTPAPQTLIDYALNSPLTSAEDKAKLENLVESGAASAEEIQAILSGEKVPDQKTQARAEKPSILEAKVEKPQQITKDQSAGLRAVAEPVQPSPVAVVPERTAAAEPPTKAGGELPLAKPGVAEAPSRVEPKLKKRTKREAALEELGQQDPNHPDVMEFVAKARELGATQWEIDEAMGIRGRGQIPATDRLRDVIDRALAEGEQLPSETLASYPDLAEKYNVRFKEPKYTSEANEATRILNLATNEDIPVDDLVAQLEGSDSPRLRGLAREYRKATDKDVAAEDLGSALELISAETISPTAQLSITPPAEVKAQPVEQGLLAQDYNTAKLNPSSFYEKYSPIRFGTANAVERRLNPHLSPDWKTASDGNLIAVKQGDTYKVFPKFGETIENVGLNAGAMGEVFDFPDLQKGKHFVTGQDTYTTKDPVTSDAYRATKPAIFTRERDTWKLVSKGEIRIGTTFPSVTPAPVPTKTAATESQTTTPKEVTDEVGAEELKGVPAPKTSEERTPQALSIEAHPPSKQAEAPSKPTNAVQRLKDWGSRLKTIAQSKNLNDLQALSDEMAAHKQDPRVARLRTSIQTQLALARQPKIPERAPEAPAAPPVTERKLSKAGEKLMREAEKPEGKTVRPPPKHRIGVPRTDSSRNSLEQQVRAYGGIRDDRDQTYKGEIAWLKESGKRGTINQTGGWKVEQMATNLAEEGYGEGVWWEGTANNVDPQAFLEALMDDIRGSTKHYSTERDVIEDDPDVQIWNEFEEDEGGREALKRVQSGRARASDILEITDTLRSRGLSERAITEFVRSLDEQVKEEIPESTEAGEGYTLDETGTLIDPDGTPLFSRAFHGSPHHFEKFSTEKIGTGQGAQSYGYGLYFTDKKEIADYYRNQLGPGRGVAPEDVAARIYQSLPDSFTEAEKRNAVIKELNTRLADSQKAGTISEPFAQMIERAKKAVETGRHTGRTYEVELAPKEDEYLLWDKPLSEQPERVRRALKEAGYGLQSLTDAQIIARAKRYFESERAQDDWYEDLGMRATIREGYKVFQESPESFRSWIRKQHPSSWIMKRMLGPLGRATEIGEGEHVYKAVISRTGSPQAASDYLHSLGIRGIKFLDQGSRRPRVVETYRGRWMVEGIGSSTDYATREEAERRANEDRTYNYVIFSDNDVEIVQQPQFAREFQLGFTEEGLTAQEAPRSKADDQRAKLLREQQEREESANPELAAAKRKLEEIRRRGMTVDEYSRQGSMFEPTPSEAEIKLLKELEKTQRRTAESTQDTLFARQSALETRLSTLHNLSADNLRYADELGGLAVPSIAVVRDDLGLSGMGEITLIGDRSLGDPAEVPVHDADVYSATFPRPEYSKVAVSKVQALVDRVRSYAAKFTNSRQILDETWDNMVNTPRPDRVLEHWRNSNAAKAMFLDENGVTTKPVLRDKPLAFPWAADKEFAEVFRRNYRAIDDRDSSVRGEESPELREVTEAARRAIQRYAQTVNLPTDDPDFGKSFLEGLGLRWGMRGHDQEHWVTDESQMMPWGPLEYQISESIRHAGQKEVDETRTTARLNRALKGKEGDFLRWVDVQVMSQFTEPFLRTKEGKRPYTLSNIVDVMTGRVRAVEETMTFGEGKARAAGARQFRGLEEMRRFATKQMGTEAEIKAARESVKEKMEAIRLKIVSGYYNPGNEEYIDRNRFGHIWEGLDAYMRALARWARSAKTEANLERQLRREGFRGEGLSVWMDDAVEAGKEWLNAPVPYFEAKPQRSVNLREFVGAVIPRKASEETRTLLKKHGIPFREYDSRKQGAQEDAVIKFRQRLAREKTQVLFARDATGSAAEEPRFAIEFNRISLNKAAADLLSDAYRESGHLAKEDRNIRGTYEKNANRLADDLDTLAAKGRPGAAEFADAVRRAGETGKNKIVLFATEGARKHELFHEASAKGYGSLKGRHADFDSLTENDTFSRMYRRLVAIGYPRYDMGLIVEEAAAHIAEGRYDMLGITRDEAVEWMYKWFQSFEKANPDVNPREFQELANEAYEARERAYTEAARRQQVADKAIPSIQEGRESRDRESIAAARGDITDSEAFRKWFGDSKVVDENGEPLVVYHGTAADFREFKNIPGTAVSGSVFGSQRHDRAGFFFTSDPSFADAFASSRSGAEDKPSQIIPVYLSIKHPIDLTYGFDSEAERKLVAQGVSDRFLLNKHPSDIWEIFDEDAGRDLVTQLQRAGYDGAKFTEETDEGEGAETYVAFKPTQIKSATGNRGTFDPNDPNILMARSEDPWANLADLADEFERTANEPELPPGEKPRSLPKTLEAAGLEAGPARGYLPESIIDDGVARAQQVISDKGVDGAMEFVRTGDGIEWASTGYEVSKQLRAQEMSLRAEGKEKEADQVRDKRLGFLDDFAMAAVERGRSIVGINAISEYAPDRMAYLLNKASLKKRKRGISPEQEAKIAAIGEELGALEQRNKELEKRLEEALSRIGTRKSAQGKKQKAPKTDYQSVLDQQASVVLQTLKPKLGKLDLTGLGREGERGALKVGIPPLPGDAELIAQYAAAQLAKHDTVADLNQHLIKTFGAEVESALPKIRQRAYAIRSEARAAEIAASETEPKRRKTILSEISKEISESLQAIRETQRAEKAAEKAERAAERKSERAEARLAAKEARQRDAAERKQTAKEARARLKRLRQEYKEASKAESAGYRETLKAQREAARKAELWDTPLRNEAAAARERLRDATDPKDPQTADDLIAVAAEKFLPAEQGGTPRTGAADPSRVYKDLKNEFPRLVTKKNQQEIYKQGYQRIQDATAAAREAARMRSASAESKRLWDELGIDVDAQAVLIRQAELVRQRDELRQKAKAEFQRVSRTFLEKAWMEAQAIPRSLMSSIDAPLGRQGAFFLLTHPILTTKTAVPATLKGYGSIHVADYVAAERELAQHPDYKLAVKSGLDLTQTTSEGDPAITTEEQFQSTLAHRFLPHVRLSEQGYVLGMNAQRLAMFSRLADVGRADGYTPETHPEFFEAVAQFVNDGTGRGHMPDAVKRASALLNFFFFSTRLNISRIQLLNDVFNPIHYVPERLNVARSVPGLTSYDPAMRKAVAGELIRLGVAVSTVYLLASAMGIKIERDPDDPDGLLLRIRNTRYDITGGEAGTIRFLYRLMRSLYRTAANEDLEEYEQPLSIASKFLRYKLAPLPSGVIDGLTGKDAVGQPANLLKFESTKQVIQQNVVVKRALPIFVGNVLDTVSEEGWIGVPMSLPALAGFGVSSYPDRGIRAIKNKEVVSLLESLKITSNSLLGQKTKDDELDKVIQSGIMERVESLEVPKGATEVGTEKIVKERLEQIRVLARADAGIAEPERYAEYLKSKEGSASVSVLTDEEKKTLTEADLKKYREIYADAYVQMLQNASKAPNWSTLTDDQKEKVLARIPRIAHNRAKIDLVKTKRGIP